jgi:hypothetical protein
MLARDAAEITKARTVNLTDDVRLLSRGDYAEVVDRFRSGQRAGKRSMEIAARQREELMQRQKAAFEQGLKGNR